MKPVILVILDGFGVAPPGPGNPVYLANPVFYKSLFQLYPNTILKASGIVVGLPAGEVGSSEVGHINIGAGRTVLQPWPRINLSVADGSFYKNEAFLKAISHVKKTGGKLHLMGLVSEGSVHSNFEHIIALIYFAKEQKVKNLFIHAFTDGRDALPKSSTNVIERLEKKLIQNGKGKIASIMGRYYAMDRDRRWERVEKAYECLTKGSAKTAKSALDVINSSYNEGKTDEFIEPTSILINGKPVVIEKGDSVIFFNFRIDRPRELTRAFVLENFERDANKKASFDPYAARARKSYLKEAPDNPPFKRGSKIEDLVFVTMTQYEEYLPVDVAYNPVIVEIPLGRVISEKNIAQVRISESEKERFVTFYLNGRREQPFNMEDHIILASPKVATYDLKPEMSSYEITDAVLEKMRGKRHGFIFVNYAAPDMVGHTGNLKACVKTVKVIDKCLEKLVRETLILDYTLLISADHGNIESKIIPETGGISTTHTINPVPFLAISNKYMNKAIRLQTGILPDLAPTVLALLEINKPGQMTGRNLLEEIHV